MTDKIVVEVESDLEDLVPVFMNSRRKDIAKLVDALASADFDTMRLVGHSMKGAGSAYGFTEVGRIGDVIEQAALARDASTVQAELARLQDHLSRLEVRFV